MNNKVRQGSVLIIVIAALALAAIGGLVYYALAQKPTASPPPVASVAIMSPSPSSTATPIDLYAGWKTFSLTKEKLQGKYPADWTFSSGDAGPGNTPDTIGQYVSLVSPKGFRIGISTGVSGVGGACPEDCLKYAETSKVLASLTFYSTPLYVVTTGFKPGAPAAPGGSTYLAVIPYKSCYANICYGYDGKNSQGIVIAHGGFGAQAGEDYRDPESFAKDPDVLTAVKIFQSLKY